MGTNRTKNASRNAVYGAVLKVYQIIVPFAMRTIMIYFLGMEYLGLNSLFTSILQILNLAELGVGSAMVYSMYKPIAQKDKTKICALMRLYRKYYRIIGIVVLVLGLILYPFIPQLVSKDVPEGIDIHVLYLLNLATTVLSYWLFAYKNCLLNAHQRNDVDSKVRILMDTLKYVGQIGAIIICKSYYAYLCVALVLQIMNNIVTSVIVSRMYPEYKPVGVLDKDEIAVINEKVRDLFTSKLGAVIINSADSVVISAFLGLKILAIYNNYYFIVKSIIGIVGSIFVACTAGIGNSIIIESKEKNFRDFNKFTFIIVWLSGLCTCCLLALYQPFIALWVGEDNSLGYSAVICFCAYYFIYELNSLFNLYKDAAGLWHKDRFRPMVTALANLGINLLLVNYIGIYGVLLSTVLTTLLIGIPWLLHNLFTELFVQSPINYLKKLVFYVFVVLISCVVTCSICSFIKGNLITTLIVRGIICGIVPNIIYFAVFRRTEEFKQMVELVQRLVGRKFRKKKND